MINVRNLIISFCLKKKSFMLHIFFHNVLQNSVQLQNFIGPSRIDKKIKSNIKRQKAYVEGGGDMARESGIECFSRFIMDILNVRERNEIKQNLGIFTAEVTEESTSGFSLLSWEVIIGVVVYLYTSLPFSVALESSKRYTHSVLFSLPKVTFIKLNTYIIRFFQLTEILSYNERKIFQLVKTKFLFE